MVDLRLPQVARIRNALSPNNDRVVQESLAGLYSSVLCQQRHVEPLHPTKQIGCEHCIPQFSPTGPGVRRICSIRNIFALKQALLLRSQRGLLQSERFPLRRNHPPLSVSGQKQTLWEWSTRGSTDIVATFCDLKSTCGPYDWLHRRLKQPDKTKTKSMTLFRSRTEKLNGSLLERVKRKFDTLFRV